jgi:phosphate transport system protein
MMTHYEQRLARDVQRIRDLVVDAARYAERSFEDAVKALIEYDQQLAYATILGDLKLNRDIRELDRQCHAFIARHLPSAGHLRFISSVLRINIAVERIGDYAVTIARETVQLSKAPPGSLTRDTQAMGKQASEMLRQAVDAFEAGNAEMARGTIAMAAQVDTTFDNVFEHLLRAGDKDKRPLSDLFALLAVFNRVERVADQAKNLCEEIIFAETGQTKVPKQYRVVFVDEHNDALSVMAEQIARKAFPESGSYASCGWTPAAALDEGFIAFMDRMGHEIDGYQPTSAAEHFDPLDVIHVAVSLQGDPRPHIPRFPFHTILQLWEIPAIPTGLDRDRTDAALTDAYRQIAGAVEDLMIALRGEGAR